MCRLITSYWFHTNFSFMGPSSLKASFSYNATITFMVLSKTLYDSNSSQSLHTSPAIFFTLAAALEVDCSAL